jgi:hypothetical protein
VIRRLLLCLLLVAPAGVSGARAQEIGAYFTLVNTYIYAGGPQKGARTLVRPRLAFPVVNVTLDGEERLWYQIVYPEKEEKTNGVGWTAKAPHELLAVDRQGAIVFSRIPEGSTAGLSLLRVPVSSLELLNETQPSQVYAQVDWQKVRYELREPLRAWARGTAGIYRVGRSAAAMAQVYGEMVSQNVEKNELIRLLSGVIRIGDTPQQVQWALGEPLRNQNEAVGETKRTTWQYPGLVVHFENDLVKQIN